MNKSIEYWSIARVGREDIYIKDKKTAQAVKYLTGKKTINRGSDMRGLLELGFTFKRVLPPDEVLDNLSTHKDDY